ncbi:hypothetical protein WJX72_003244 [[Myrmecia] bisecta]|uniref:Dynamin n=1 Tax=[Myrmecia] bisecta TaxID=41462 RepID=A0AAW1P4R8_9CHLO
MAASAQPESVGETLIPAINRLQDIFSQVTLDFKLELPQVAVIGSQSSGKSSVLEALVGRDFLPRGPDICTRRPLVLQLVKQPPSNSPTEWGEFLHCPGKRFFDFDRIRQEILQETERVVGANKGISDKPIRLKICSPHVLTMTLVDLPGIAKVPVGDQPSDIEDRLCKMILEYIRHPTCVILAVSPANVDLVNSDALQLARSVDPDGHRTIGVLTKLDIMDRGTDASAVLKNEVVPLKMGYIGVINRSQHDINTRRNMRDSRTAEAAFFESHPEYVEVAAQCGIANLARSLNRILVEHIRTLLPTLRGHIEQALDKRIAELRVYGDMPPGQSGAARGALLLQLLDTYAVRYSEMLDGRSEHMPVSELAGGARIRHIFQEIFVVKLTELNPASELTDEAVRTAIKNSAGVKGTLLIPDAPFELLVRRAILRLLPIVLQCKEYVHTELLRIASQCSPPDVARFPALQSRLTSAVEDFIDQGAGPAERMIRDLVECEHSYINTDHPAFVGGTDALATVMNRRQPADEEEEHEAESSTGHSDGHPRTKSCGNLQDVPSNSHPPPAPPSRHSGRPPLRENGLGLKALRTSVRAHPLKGVEPELFSPEELLHSRSAGLASSSHQPAGSNGESGSHDDGSTTGWFSQWFHPSQGGGPQQPPRRHTTGGDEARVPLNQPPHTLKVPHQISDQDQVQVEVTRLLVENYFDIVRHNLEDAVPKAIMHFLVYCVQRGLQQHLIRTLYREELFAEMMTEREDIAAKRLQCQQALKALREALTTLESLPSTLMSRINAASSRQAIDDRQRSAPNDSESLQSYASRAALQPARAPKPLQGAARMAVAAMACISHQASGELQPNPFGGF